MNHHAPINGRVPLPVLGRRAHTFEFTIGLVALTTGLARLADPIRSPSPMLRLLCGQLP